MRRKRKKRQESTDSGNALSARHDLIVMKWLSEERPRLVPLCLGLFFLLIYLLTLMPGVDAGDSAELQFMSPILGVCHPPGYSIQISFGKIFSHLPIGPSIAWRINFMMAISGTIGVLAIYGTIRRITASFLAGIVAASTLGFSSMYWAHSVVAEVYVFYSMFLLVGIYCLVRFIATNKAFWLFLGMFSIGICIADRISEVVVLPGFLLLWCSVRKNANLGIIRLVTALVIMLMPFVFTVGFCMVRHHPVNRFERLHDRDSALRFQIIGDNFEIPPAPSFSKQVQQGINRCLALTYKKDAKFDPEVMRLDVNKYAWMLSGFGAMGYRYPDKDRRNSEQGKGTSIGILGLALCIFALVFQWEKWGWLSLGVWMFLSNLGFILWHHRWDNLTFTVPGLIGLSLLAGLGAAGGNFRPKTSLLYRILCVMVPLFLFVTNYSHLNRNTEQEKQRQQNLQKLSQASFPEDSVIISTYWPAMTYRYLIHIEAGRSDVRILHESPQNWQKLIHYFMQKNKPVYLLKTSLNPQILPHSQVLTETDIWDAGFARLPAFQP